ncbi:hypothetical protein [Kribbella shirazensis]|uniref:Uncharacterized protein n=1 Tax=Kribbella shirazensis TaxID=1105143 RepID=A0A7X5V775_9ACTN|nr:hypothetical protein [Kribbella shirazensis]NIK55903.1 hypothetical protein [Kribbella shirazensis]
MLDVLGLDAIEEGAYRRLITLPSESVEELAASLRVEMSDLAAALDGL